MSIKVERASVHCEVTDHELYKSLATGGSRNPLEVPFDSMLDAFVAFACLGYHHGRYVPLQRSQEMTLSSYIDQDLDLFVLAALAYAHLRSQDPDRSIEDVVTELTTTKTIIPIVEGWANGGVRIYRESMESGAVYPTLTLYEMLQEAQAELHGSSPGPSAGK